MGHAEDRLPELSVLRILVLLRLVDGAVFERAAAFLHPLNKALTAFFSGCQLLCLFWIRTFRHIPRFLCAPSVFSVPLWWFCLETNHHRGTENTEGAQRRSLCNWSKPLRPL